MDRELLDKYFNDQCSEEELEQVLRWFQTDEGRSFIENDIKRQNQHLMKNADTFLFPEIASKKIFSRIQLNKKKGLKRRRRFGARVASIVMMAVVISSLLYWGGITTILKNKNASPALITYATAPGQQKIFKLSDGTKIRLNEGSTLMVPGKSSRGKRSVILKGEAYFEVVHDPDHPFIISAGQSIIRDIGTKFNVKIDAVSKSIQVAVLAGKVSLEKEGADGASALLTRNHFGTLRLSDSQITIEKGNVENYLSWINKRLLFRGESLQQVSRQLEHLYDVRIQFETDRLKGLNLTADLEKTDVRNVLAIISQTLDINFKMNQNKVVWTE